MNSTLLINNKVKLIYEKLLERIVQFPTVSNLRIQDMQSPVIKYEL